MSIAGSMEIFAGPEALAQRAATLIGERMAGCEAPFRLVLAGGSTPREAYRKLAYSNALPWDCVELFFGDERFVPPSHPDSNTAWRAKHCWAVERCSRGACSPSPPMTRRTAPPPAMTKSCASNMAPRCWSQMCRCSI